MLYRIILPEQPLALETDSKDILFVELAKLPDGEYTIEVLDDKRRSGKHRRGSFTTTWLPYIQLALGIITAMLAFASLIAMYILIVWIFG